MAANSPDLLSSRSPDPSSALRACAVAESRSRGRQYVEPAGGLSGFALDRQRVLQCAAFRRLQYKTQVLVTDEGDHFRTRLSHTLEVAAQARRLAVGLRLSSDLAETIALAHDLGHPPFGHAGEKALAQRMAPHGGFEHNLQSLRVVDYLEHPYPDFRGLNLAFEVREGLVKHQTRYDRPAATEVVDANDPRGGGPQSTLEAQIVNLADELTYTLHDIEDGLMNGLFDEAALESTLLWRNAAQGWRQRFGSLHVAGLRRAVLDTVQEILVEDAIRETAERIEAAAPGAPDDVRMRPDPLAAFSGAARGWLDEIGAFLKSCYYTHERVRRMDAEAAATIAAMFDACLADPARMPPRFLARVAEQGAARVACDYIAGMTDRYCSAERARIAGKTTGG